jgi:hypothetical protein
MEIWKPIIEYENKYEVSNMGNVRNSSTKINKKLNFKNGYHYVSINNKSLRVHRLVANAFIQNNDVKKTYVNHIDGNKINNNLLNLEYITPTDNVKHAIINNLLVVPKREVCQYDLNNNFIKFFNSIIEASNETTIDDGTICKVCKYYETGKGINKSAGGFIWKYKNQNQNQLNTDLEMFKLKEYQNYSITKCGKVYSNARKRFLTLLENEDGYSRVHLINNNGIRKGPLVHRLVAETFISNPDNKTQVNHKNMIRNDNRVENLEWVTNSENIIHSIKNRK